MPWLILTATLPTSPSGLRVRVWRTLKTIGCAPLREGVYLLPADAPTAKDFWAIEQVIRDGGADAHMLEVTARDAAQEATFKALFDRSEQYADFAQSLKDARKGIAGRTEADLRKALRTLEQQLQSILAMDYFAGKPAAAAKTALETLRAEVERRLSPGEPAAAAGDMPRLDVKAYQGRTWATRARPWVDRLATAWLVLRFVDRAPTFRWLADARKCSKSALGYDFDGATFTHVGDKVSFEVVAAAFGLDEDPALIRLGQLVHFIDIGGIPVDEASGVEMLVRGLQAIHAKDDALLAAAVPMFDSLYAALRQGRVDVSALRALLTPQPWPTRPPIYAVDVSLWPRCDAETSAECGFSVLYALAISPSELPGTANKLIFLILEDETGHTHIVLHERFVQVKGRLLDQDGMFTNGPFYLPRDWITGGS